MPGGRGNHTLYDQNRATRDCRVRTRVRDLLGLWPHLPAQACPDRARRGDNLLPCETDDAVCTAARAQDRRRRRASSASAEHGSSMGDTKETKAERRQLSRLLKEYHEVLTRLSF